MFDLRFKVPCRLILRQLCDRRTSGLLALDPGGAYPIMSVRTLVEVSSLQWTGRGDPLHTVPAVPIRIRVR
jgi:hypothetical protein